MRAPTRLASVSLLTAGLYLSAALWCTAPARAADPPNGDPARGDQAGGEGEGDAGSGRAGARAPDPLAQEEPVDPDTYVVGPGDLLALQVWGRQNFVLPLRVDPQGTLYIRNVGPVRATGLTLTALQKAVSTKVKVTYPRLEHAITLVRPRVFIVQVAGLVKNPDGHRVTALTRVSRVLAMAGGRSTGGSQTRIEVRRQGKVVIANLVPFYLNGDRSQNPRLLEGDVVYVPPIAKECSISGAVNRPGSYELRDGQTLGDLIDLAGGVLREASARLPVTLTRRVQADKVATRKLPPPTDPAIRAVRLQDEDQLFFPSVSEVQRAIFVQGAVAAGRNAAAAAGPDKRVDTAGSAPREFTLSLPYREGETVRTIIDRAGGLLPWADARNAFIERRQPDGSSKRIPFDGRALVILRDLTHDVPVLAGDTVYIPAEREGVMVSGPVYRPGLYQHSPRYTAVDYINLAGGPTPNGTVSGGKVITADGQRIPVDEAKTVSPGDTVAVKQKFLTTFEWVQILLTIASLSLSATALAITLKK